jgi:hypothetical protein
MSMGGHTRTFLIFALLLAPGTAGAITSAELNAVCAGRTGDSAADLSCISYVRGLVDGLLMASGPTPVGQGYCPPPDLTLPQAITLIVKQFRDHPEQLGQEAGLVAGRALIAAYPCAIDAPPTRSTRRLLR